MHCIKALPEYLDSPNTVQCTRVRRQPPQTHKWAGKTSHSFFFFFLRGDATKFWLLHHCCYHDSLGGRGLFVPRWAAATSNHSLLSQAAKCRAPLTRQTKWGACWWMSLLKSDSSLPAHSKTKRKPKKRFKKLQLNPDKFGWDWPSGSRINEWINVQLGKPQRHTITVLSALLSHWQNVLHLR